MVEIKSDLTRVEQYDNYIIEVRHPNPVELEDEITDALDRNRESVGTSLGDDAVYVKPSGSDAIEEFLAKLDKGLDIHTMPWLILLDRHPAEVEAGDEILVMELGQYNSERQVRTTLQEIHKALGDEEFMNELTTDERAERLRRALPFLGSGAAVVADAVTVATVVL